MTAEHWLHLSFLVVCWGYLGYALKTGRFPTRKYVHNGRVQRSEQPGAYWSFCAMLAAIGTLWLLEFARSL